MAKKVTSRFIDCFDLAKKRGLIRSAREFALNIGCHPQSLHEVLKGRRDVTVDMLEGAINRYQFSTKYIFQNLGNPRVGLSHKAIHLKDIPLVRASAVRSYCTTPDSEDFCQRLPHLTYFGLSEQSTHRAFEIEDNNEELGIRSGDILICSQIEKEQWHQEIRDEFVYLILSDEELRVRMVKNMLGLRNMLVLSASYASDAAKQLLTPDEVREIWEIRKIISSHVQTRQKRWTHDQKISRIEDMLSHQGEIIDKLRESMMSGHEHH